MKSNKKGILRRTRKEEIEFRKLQKAISQLPKPAFNNPERVQPTSEVNLPTAVPATLEVENTAIDSEKALKPIDKTIILDNIGLRIERVAKVKAPRKRSTIKRFAKYLKPNLGLLIISILCAFIYTVFEIFVPLIIGKGIDAIIGAGQVDFRTLIVYMIALGVCAIGYSGFHWLTEKTANTVAYRVEKAMHIEMFNKFNKVAIKYIDGSSHGDLQSRMINDVDTITDGFVLGLTTFFDCIATISLTLVFMFLISPIISVIVICLTPLSIIIAFVIAKKTNKLFRRQAKNLGDLSGNVVEMLGNQKVVKAFQYEDRSIQKFDVLNAKLRDSSQKAIFYASITGPTSRFINGIIYAIVAILGTIFAIKGTISIGYISTLLAYANKYVKPFNAIADVFSDIQESLASAVRVFSVLDIENEVSDESLPEIKRNNGTVEFKNVDFSYSKDKKLIQNLNISVKKGQKVAIVGPTGCGKSTIINLLMRFYDIDKGEILISGKPINEITRKSLRNQFGMVLQETWLFSASIRDNIAYGKPDATDAEVRRAAKLAGADYFISTLPNGYDTIVNESGDNLSQGQKQLICIARLMITKPPMLILDEATSNIDTRTELAIQEAFNKIMKGRTSFIVAHRLSTIVTADLILVMNKGNIIEQGTHKELLAKKGFYYNLYNSQFSNY